MKFGSLWVLVYSFLGPLWGVAEEVFVHPGLLHSAEDLAAIKGGIVEKAEPWMGGWNLLQASVVASLNEEPEPIEEVIRGAYNKPDIGSSQMSEEASNAYSHALVWALTGKQEHADQAIKILNAWSGVLRSVTGHDARLLVGIDGVKFCNAAELLKHSKSGWREEDQARFEKMLREVFYPTIQDFHPTANGNWDASMIQTMLAIGIYLDDRKIFDQAVNYFREGEGNGAIKKYLNDFGECQESGRDQLHVQMGLGYLSCACEMAWKQGVDLYGEAENRLALGFEYTAKYNLGEEVPFAAYRSVEGRYHYRKISSRGRGRLRPIYERVANHYHVRKGLELPHTRAAAEKIRPEGEHRQHMPWGTLMHYGLPAKESE